MPSFCWKCGKQLARTTAGKAAGTIVFDTRNYHGVEITMHKDCAKDFDKEEVNDKWDWGKGPNSFKAFDD